ncbi:hypothetical protein [uncultured Azohydromonas sp.]|mgnify:CR=1 FL=1|jgi:hypothetical protein|uniref:hypothetical protein n=1 Tax=uncultured Azohydromonas sp. TaxID=487342 RepID=UPI002637345B|nr:hypothetical protein [uncultured Azohydromonas sp.]
MDKALAVLVLAFSALCIHGCTRAPVGNLDQAALDGDHGEYETAHGGDHAAPSWRQ